MSNGSSYAVEYSPASSPSQSALTVEYLRSSGTRYIRLQWVDLTNLVRFRVLPITYFLKLLKTSRPSVSITKASMGLIFLTLAPGFSAIGEYIYVADLSSLRTCGYAPNTASCMGYFQEKAPVLAPNGQLTLQVELCPRDLLRRVAAEAKSVSGVEFLVGFEVEFILLKSTSPVEAVNVHPWTTSAGLPSGAVETKVLEEIADALQDSGIELQMYHPEAAPGQYEVVTGPLPPLQAVDALVHTRETITNIAVKHGLRATQAPRVYMDSCGSALHTHISVHSPKPQPSPISVLNRHESSFLSGLLTHLPAITALTLALPASYKRMVDGAWSGGTYVCWGTDNREAPVRLCNAAAPAARNFEFRQLDGTANPYVALAGILGAGHVGIRENAALNVQEISGGRAAAEMSEAERRALGITQRLPLTWEEARERLQEDKVVRGVLGEELVTKYLSANETMAKAFGVGTEEEALTRLVENF